MQRYYDLTSLTIQNETQKKTKKNENKRKQNEKKRRSNMHA